MPFVEPVNIVCSAKTDLDYDLECKRNDTDLAQSIQNPFSPQSPLSPLKDPLKLILKKPA